ncbi:MAG: leucine-rich repeat domain-containing protein, partial [Rickettsiales bacterium]|jgi:hypothetical protein|nr:leucine-rich repeat domain-containing protein [Rickettsiales bacterium]
MGKWNNDITILRYSFYNTAMNEISKNAFKYLTKMNSFPGVFEACKSLKELPAGLFDHNADVKSFSHAFNSSSLTSIPFGLFKNNINVTDFSGVFRLNTSLTSIPDDLFKYNNKVTSFLLTFQGSANLLCADVASAAIRGGWPKWNASGVDMAKTIMDTKKGSAAGGEKSETGYCSACTINTASLIPSDKNLKVTWYKSTDTNKTTPLADGAIINYSDIIVADASCKNELTNTLYANMSDFDDDSKNELMYGVFGADYSFICSTSGAIIAEGAPGTKACKGYIPAHILYEAAGSNDGFIINNSTNTNRNNNGTINECIVDWGDGKTSECKNGDNPHSYTSAGDYHIRVYGEKFIGFCSYNNVDYCGSDAAKTPNYRTKFKKLYSMGEWSNIRTLVTAFMNCTNLDEMSKNTFKRLVKITTFMDTFNGCSKLASISENLFKYNTEVTSFSNVFRSSGLTSIPENLFKYNTKVTTFTSAFYDCRSIAKIPSNLFLENKKALYFNYTFRNCVGLTSVPADLFQNHESATNFEYVFDGCTNLLCKNIATAAANWPKWNKGATMTNAVYLTKKGAVAGGETSTTGVCSE